MVFPPQDDDERRDAMFALSDSAQHYGTLLRLLSGGDTVSELAWQVLQLLPSNASLNTAMLEFKTSSAPAPVAAHPPQDPNAKKRTYASTTASAPQKPPPPPAPVVPGLTDVTWTSLLTSTEPTRLLNSLLIVEELAIPVAGPVPPMETPVPAISPAGSAAPAPAAAHDSEGEESAVMCASWCDRFVSEGGLSYLLRALQTLSTHTGTTTTRTPTVLACWALCFKLLAYLIQVAVARL